MRLQDTEQLALPQRRGSDGHLRPRFYAFIRRGWSMRGRLVPGTEVRYWRMIQLLLLLHGVLDGSYAIT